MYGLDLFSGIGGLTKALDGYVWPAAYCEIDAYARGVLLSRMASGDLPVAPVWDDVTSLQGWALPPIDIVYGGFPCQDISVAGRQKGLAGERSGLFFEIVRLARETSAEWIFLENVPNIRTKGLGTVLQTLESVGYDCRWGLLSAADVGANHKRERWFLLAHAKSAGSGRITGGNEERLAGAGSGGTHLVDPSSQGSFPAAHGGVHRGKESAGIWNGELERPGWWSVEPNVGRVANGIPKRVDRLRALGNAVVPAQAREAFERLMGLK